jgi:hypothetical protein
MSVPSSHHVFTKKEANIIIITDQGEHQNSSMSVFLPKIGCKRTAEKTHQGYP